jgi:hypothetical protein
LIQIIGNTVDRTVSAVTLPPVGLWLNVFKSESVLDTTGLCPCSISRVIPIDPGIQTLGYINHSMSMRILVGQMTGI